MSNKDWSRLQEKVGDWADNTFTHSDLQGLLNHLVEEAEDLKKDPHNSLNYADVLILLLTLARKIHYNTDDLYCAVEAKLTINQSRNWLEADENGVYRHVKTKE